MANWPLALIVIIIGASFLSFNAKGNLLATDATITGSIALIAILLYLKKPDEPASEEAIPWKGFFGLKELSIMLAIFAVLVTILYLILFIMAPLLFILSIWNVMARRRKKKRYLSP